VCFDRGRLAVELGPAVLASDGRDMYAAAVSENSSYLLRFSRDPATGLLRLAGDCLRTGPFQRDPYERRRVCTAAPWLPEGYDLDHLALSPDGQHLYLIGGLAPPTVLRRDLRDGSLHRVHTQSHCRGSSFIGDPCGLLLGGEWHFSLDGRNVDVLATWQLRMYLARAIVHATTGTLLRGRQ